MKIYLSILLAFLFPVLAQARVLEQLYDTNSQAAVDAHVITLISGPTNGASLATITNIWLGLAADNVVSNSQHSVTAGISTNSGTPYSYVNLYSTFDTNRLFITASGSILTNTMTYWNAARLAYTNGLLEVGLRFDTNGDQVDYFMIGHYPLGANPADILYYLIPNTNGAPMWRNYYKDNWLAYSGVGQSPRTRFPTNNYSVAEIAYLAPEQIAASNNTVYVDPIGGNDQTGIRGLKNYPFATLTTAIKFSKEGDTIKLASGTYNRWQEGDFTGGAIGAEGEGIKIPISCTIIGDCKESVILPFQLDIITNKITVCGLSAQLFFVGNANAGLLTNIFLTDVKGIGNGDALYLNGPCVGAAWNSDFTASGDTLYEASNSTNALFKLFDCNLISDDSIWPNWNESGNGGRCRGITIGMGKIEMWGGSIQIYQTNTGVGFENFCIGDEQVSTTNVVGSGIFHGVQCFISTNSPGSTTNRFIGLYHNTRIELHDMSVAPINEKVILNPSNSVFWITPTVYQTNNQPFVILTTNNATFTFPLTVSTLNGNGSGLTNLMATNTVNLALIFSSVTNQLILNNGTWFLSAAGPGALTNVICPATHCSAVLIVTNSSAVTNTFAVTAPFNKMNSSTTNKVNIEPGKVAYFMFDYIFGKTNGWTSQQQ